MRKYSVWLLVVILLCISLLGACEKQKDSSPTFVTEPPVEYVPNTDPTPIEIDPNEGSFLGIQTETEYKQIVVTSIKEVYSLKEDTYFACSIANEHIGHGFNVYKYVYIEKWIDGQWVRQCNQRAIDEQYLESGWVFIGSDGNTDGVNKSRLSIGISKISPEVTPGRYRMVVFTPLTTEYAEFEVQE